MLPSSLIEPYQAWLTWLKASKGVATHTYTSYAHDVKTFLIFLTHHWGGEISCNRLTELTSRDIRAFLANRLATNTSHRTNARNISALKSFMAFLETERGLSCTAFVNLSLPRLPKRLPRPLEIDNIRELILAISDHDWAGTRDRALFLLLYGTGLRISEALSLTIRDVSGESILTIRGKGQKERIVPLIKECSALVSTYRKACPYAESPDRALFLGVRGKPVSAGIIQQSMRRVRKVLNLPDEATPHALRHSFASHLLANGANLREVQALLGHTNLATTQQYIDVNVQQLIKIHKDSHPREERPIRKESHEKTPDKKRK